jgi:phenylacetate-coenzyme A ligase PaaK-like adenylate-forming protein
MSLVSGIRHNHFVTIPVMKWIKTDVYKRFLMLLNESENWTIDQVDKWQLKKVGDMVDYAFSHVPGYNKKYKSVGYELGSIRSWSDFEHLPFLSKEDIKENFAEYCSD